MLKDMIKKILMGEGKKEPVDSQPNSVMAKKKTGFYDELKKSRGVAGNKSGREAMLALEDAE